MTIAKTPSPPYYAVIFTSIRADDDYGYHQMSDAMLQLATKQPGFLGIESVRNELGITVSYWDSLDSITAWKKNFSHLIAQNAGRNNWYSSYQVRVCRVERDYGFLKS